LNEDQPADAPRKAGKAAGGRAESATSTEELCSRMREDIVRCVLAPHARLKFGDLQLRYSASIGTLREALLQLVAEGIVISESFRGFCVAPISLDDLRDLTELRVEFENRALRASIQLGDDQWEARIVAAMHMLSKIKHIGSDSSDAELINWEDRHGRFHDALLSACPSRRVMQIRKTLYDQGRRYRNLPLARTGAVFTHDYQHQELANLALARDADAACALMTEHIMEASRNAAKLVE
jgi:GntR family carbon starvation induced transcriptional regulator